jgi:methylenetetrahydrofolate dehydrogenase (NADP+) / methenyltetrahydrofolate cyclohydrolase
MIFGILLKNTWMTEIDRSKLLDGVEVAEGLYQELTADLKKYSLRAKLQILLVGENPSSLIYVKQKIKACERLGLEVELNQITNPDEFKTDLIVDLVNKYNQDPKITGLIVQMPLPEQVDKTKVIEAIDPNKDVDGLSPYNMGQTLLGIEFEYLTPCTATGICRMLDHYKIAVLGKRVAVIGQGRIAGKPTAVMMMNRGATVISCNSKTPDIAEFTANADIIIVAVGHPMLIKPEMVKEGAVVVDVGITRLKDGSISGDSDFDGLLKKVSRISPVPGGVGKMTVACLMRNLVKAAKRNLK